MSRDDILARIRRHRPAASALPDLHAPAFISYPDRYAQFATLVGNLGGHALTLAPGQSVREAVDAHWPEQGRVVDTTQAMLDEAQTPHDWADVDIAIVPGQLAVAENAAVWVSQDALAYRSLYFLAQRLVMVVPQDALVDTMRDAYDRVEFATHGFGSFISGSSRTADIEQSLVMGAHGAMAALVVFE